MQSFATSPREMGASLWRNRSLILSLTQREVEGRYRGSMIGLLWSFLHPVLMLAVYTFVFSVVFKSRWSGVGSGGDGSRGEFALVLFSGLIVFNMLAECMNRAPSLILNNANYVKKVVFPLEILPVVAFGATLFHTAISFFVWLLFYLILFGLPHLTALWFPVILLPLMFGTLGVSWLLSSLGVYVRDVAQIIGILTTMLMFLSPIFFPASALPENYRPLLNLNPLTTVLEQSRAALMWAQAPDLSMLALCLVIGAIIAWLGFAWFQKTRKGFADVL